jgi:hypothetical protein
MVHKLKKLPIISDLKNQVYFTRNTKNYPKMLQNYFMCYSLETDLHFYRTTYDQIVKHLKFILQFLILF